MKKLISFCLLISAAFTSYGQQREVEDFINQAYLAVVPASFKYYNLIDSSCAIAPDRYSLVKDDFYDIVKIYPDFPASFFLQQAFPSERVDWKEYHLIKTRLYSAATAPSLPVGMVLYRVVPFTIAKARLDSLNRSKKHYEILVPTKKHWSQKRIAKAAQKAQIDYANSISQEDRVSYRFSVPLIAPDKSYAIVKLNQSGMGCIYIFKRIGDNWVKIGQCNCWVS